jgi:hypothetical protein
MAKPYVMASATWHATPAGCTAPVPTLQSAVPTQQQVTMTWSNEHAADPHVKGYNLYCDRPNKSPLVARLGPVTSYDDTGLTNGQQYCYKVTSRVKVDTDGDGTPECVAESDYSNILCAVPVEQSGFIQLPLVISHTAK